ncbi:hypothetical protein TNIN_82831 [Trichonephila inaurata madagascariensis]|uniref:Uncharacterized protein n=1 Tax=Trichonephila inaurata madagascariensis TaxID=2747483 RepID=A0A8X6IBC5_9ARAC|nr:hypothetical protein TNIN_82831 [Trichonephila inaurata madagascariensis]
MGTNHLRKKNTFSTKKSSLKQTAKTLSILFQLSFLSLSPLRTNSREPFTMPSISLMQPKSQSPAALAGLRNFPEHRETSPLSPREPGEQ